MRLICLLTAFAFGAGSCSPGAAQDYLPTGADRARIERAIEAERPSFDPPPGVTGITVPHHLLAADLIARGFWAASAGEYERVLLLAPDHFGLVEEGFGVGASDAETILGGVPADAGAARRLLESDGPFAPHPDIGAEHAVGAVLPFVARFLPGVPVLPVVASARAGPESWAAAVELLAPLAGEGTLVVQSTDYAHHVPAGQAVLLDQETLAAIAAGDVSGLRQPDQLDAKAAQHLQMELQARRGATGAIVANRNSVEYGADPRATTSYVVTVYHANPGVLSRLRYDDHAALYFGGDVLLGRHVAPHLGDAERVAAVLEAVKAATALGDLVVNLEGVLADHAVAGAPELSHLMHLGLAAPMLRYMGVVAAGVANNHAWDFGASGAAMTLRALTGTGVRPLPHGQVVDLGPARVVALNALPGRAPHLAAGGAAEVCAAEARAPLVAFMHWGREGSGEPGPAERRIATELSRCGVSAALGAHSHVASTSIEVTGRMPWIFSLGNFLFDQTGDRVSGAVAELRVFRQGTVALRLIPLPNLFEIARRAQDSQGEAGFQ